MRKYNVIISFQKVLEVSTRNPLVKAEVLQVYPKHFLYYGNDELSHTGFVYIGNTIDHNVNN